MHKLQFSEFCTLKRLMHVDAIKIDIYFILMKQETLYIRSVPSLVETSKRAMSKEYRLTLKRITNVQSVTSIFTNYRIVVSIKIL